MKEEIKQRIELIKNGQVPHGYKKTKVGILPEDWEEVHFKSIFSRITRKNTENNENVLTISAQYGLIVDYRQLITKLDDAMQVYSGAGLENFESNDLKNTITDIIDIISKIRNYNAR